MASWTNRVIHANEHRVLYPPGAGAQIPRRQSIIYFLNPAWEATVTPATSCDARTSEVLPPLHVGEYLLRTRTAYSARDEPELPEEAALTRRPTALPD